MTTDYIKGMERARGRLDAPDSLAAAVAAGDARDKELSREIARLERAPLPDDEIESRVVRPWAAGKGQRILSEYGPTLLGLFADPTRLRSAVSLPPGLSDLDLRCAADADAVVAQIMGIIKQVPHESGLPAAERPAMLATLKAEQQALSEARARLVDEALAHGILIQHSPETIRRREAEARARALDEQRVADAQARHQAIDDSYGQRTRLVNMDAERRTGGQSNYLATGTLNGGSR